ncbi:hypothetical protein [Enterobacter quasiroggenkampii]|uniref:hypothetical protein n=1 Tax=Enterobacter quasiroggenkampii TaxID=2497436 RepID=UPI0039C43164
MPIVRFWPLVAMFAFANERLIELFSYLSQGSATTAMMSKTISAFFLPLHTALPLADAAVFEFGIPSPVDVNPSTELIEMFAATPKVVKLASGAGRHHNAEGQFSSGTPKR